MNKTILLTNDDGFLSPGLRHLRDVLSGSYDVYIVAPDGERSAVSMSLTLNRPLRIHQIGNHEYEIDGTPVDCVNIALDKILPHRPDLVVSGMNMGENLSEDVFFSGTVGGAFAAHLYGVPALAVSLIPGVIEDPDHEPSGYNYSSGTVYDFEGGAKITARVVEKLLGSRDLMEMGVVFNMNIPHENSGEIMITSQGLKQYKPDVIENTDPRGRKYFWFGTGDPNSIGPEGSDIDAVKKGFISLTALKYDLNTRKESDILTDAFKDNV